ncbi:MAG: hypothetical protein JNN30_12410, partial [Rhodanobacteraceae bacterium]|nr:hypothetical protein [Rhodanobacteraceae bacterium]
RLRAWLDREGNRLMLIATATGAVDFDYERPLFQALQSVRLKPWEPEQAIEYFNRRRTAEGGAPLDGQQLAKARAVADFIGGNPRLAQLLAGVLDSHDAMSVVEVMDALADRLADYYRRRIDDLAPLAQGLLDALIRGGEPASQTELARRVNASGQADIARPMQDLLRADVVRGVPAPDGRETLYRVTDRVFVHFYRVRQGQQAALRTPLATILEFLQSFYSADEKRAQARAALDRGQAPNAQLFARLALDGQPQYALHSAYVLGFDGRWDRVLRHLDEPVPEPMRARGSALTAEPGDQVTAARPWVPRTEVGLAARAIFEAHGLVRMGLESDAKKLLDDTRSAESDDLTAQMLLRHELVVVSYFVDRDRASAVQAAAALGALADRAPTTDLRLMALLEKSFALGMDAEHDRAIETAREAAHLAAETEAVGEQAMALRFAAWSMGQLARYEEAVAAAQEASQFASQAGDLRGQAVALRYAAGSLGQLDRHAEAVATAQEASQLASQAGDLREQAVALRYAAGSLGQLDRHAEAVATAQEASQLASQAGHLREQAEALRYAAWSMGRVGRHEDAVAMARRAAELARHTGDRAEEAESLRIAALNLDQDHPRNAAAVLHASLDNLRSEPDAGNPRRLWSSLGASLLAAQWVESREAVAAFGQALGRQAAQESQHDAMDWSGQWLAAAIRANAWPEVDAVLSAHPEALAKSILAFSEAPGKALGRVAEHSGRAAAFETTREVLRRVRRLVAEDDSDGWKVRSMVSSLVTGLGTSSRDPGLYRDIAGLLTAELSAGAPEQAQLLIELAQLDEAEDPQARLARVDPDVAIWLRRVRQLPEPEPKPRRVRERKPK